MITKHPDHPGRDGLSPFIGVHGRLAPCSPATPETADETAFVERAARMSVADLNKRLDAAWQAYLIDYERAGGVFLDHQEIRREIALLAYAAQMQDARAQE